LVDADPDASGESAIALPPKVAAKPATNAASNDSLLRFIGQSPPTTFLRPYDTDPQLNTKKVYHFALSESMQPKLEFTHFLASTDQALAKAADF
jgi:hypothetical protein